MGDVRPVIVVTGLDREARQVSGIGVRFVCGGGSAQALAAQLSVLAGDAAGIISFGMAGALDPGLNLGDWVIGSRLTGAVQEACDPAWVAALARCLPRARVGTCFADGRMISTPGAKRDLASRYHALAVDMESHVAAAAAAKAQLPFAILRCVSDEAISALPPAIGVSMAAGGGLALGAILASVVRQPGQIPALVRATLGFARAFATLGPTARACGPRLAFDQRQTAAVVRARR